MGNKILVNYFAFIDVLLTLAATILLDTKSDMYSIIMSVCVKVSCLFVSYNNLQIYLIDCD